MNAVIQVCVFALTSRQLFFVDGEKFDFKDERHIWADLRAISRLSISEVGRDKDLPLVADAHELQSFCPPRNNAVKRKDVGLATLIGAVEDTSIDKTASIVDFDEIQRSGMCRRDLPFGQYFILQAACQSGHTFFTLIFTQKRLTLLFIFYCNLSKLLALL